MFETGVEMTRQTLRRENPGLTPLEIDARLRAPLSKRPGAEFGDTIGPAPLAPPVAADGAIRRSSSARTPE